MSDLIPVLIDIRGENRKIVEDIADKVLRKVLFEEEETDATNVTLTKTPTPAESSTPSTAPSSPPPLFINQLLSSSLSQQSSLPAPMPLNPFQLALCQSLVTNSALPVSIFGCASPFLHMFVPPPQQPAVESVELLKIFQSILAKQKK